MPASEPRYIDYYFRDFISRITPESSAELLEVMVELSRALSQQHSCLDLASRQNKQQLMEELQKLELIGSRNSPLSLFKEKLYFTRYYYYEKTIVEQVITFNKAMPVTDQEKLSAALRDRYQPDREIDWQQIATLQALTRQLTIITGGPGTGKTTTVATTIDLLRELATTTLQIRLAAPTGKAAMRLSQSLSNTDDDNLRVQTLHRLLGVRRDGRSFRFSADNPIACDVLIVDEASMIDLPMMYRVLTALPDHCRLILVGDPDQLPSVETGNVLADLCSPSAGYSDALIDLSKEVLDITLPRNEVSHPLNDAICRLMVSHRFSSNKGIGRIAQHIVEQNAELPVEDDEITVSDPQSLMSGERSSLLLAHYQEYVELLRSSETNPIVLSQTFERVRLLSPMRDGDLGVQDLNDTIEQELEQQGLKTPFNDFYHGRPILVLRNDYNLQLYNGDVGICIERDDLQHPMVAFPTLHDNAEGNARLLLASRLPPHETCFAMTVHKSQGSEFNAVTLILPPLLNDSTEQLLSKELLYTAVTRARSQVTLYCTQPVWQHCVTTSEPRVSGLSDFLATGGPDSTTNKQLSLF